MRHEIRDVYVKWIWGTALGLALAVLMVAGLCWGLMRFWRQGVDANDYSPDANIANESVSIPANSVDGHTPVGNLTRPAPGTTTYLTDTNQRLHSFGWANQTNRTVHIPIEDAMHLLVQKGKK
jgi:hypothetical protein